MLSRTALSKTAKTISRYQQTIVKCSRQFSSSNLSREHYLDASAEVFEKQVTNGSKVAIVDFYADWCGPCRMLTPTLKATVTPESGYDLVTVDTDKEIELAQKYKVSALPTVVAIKGGKEVGRFVGALPPPGVKQFLDSLKGK
ncbi:thioredoxin-like protein [Meredithblackwellia eburnea MCA 4105]